ncbi:hypothetical protein [Cryptosporangium sp. NPDC048952]|uniref:hypothetical protein n=1 Tax=Cryptosporangium sp. NPDC048952 TaxID=3363961 RepID=UPI003717B815
MEWPLRVAAVLVGTLIVVTTELIAAFLTPFRIGATPIPISWVIVVVGIVLGLFVTRYGSGQGSLTIVPAVAWFVTIFPLSTRTAEGDLVVQGDWVGYGILLIGMLTIVATLAVTVVIPRSQGNLVP